jgi:hypothetical protein
VGSEKNAIVTRKESAADFSIQLKYGEFQGKA